LLGLIGIVALAAGLGMIQLVNRSRLEALERSMDAMQKSLKPLNSFVLPGGSWPNAWLHLCRAHCRRAERIAVSQARREKVPPEALRYPNRLSDWFFVAARYAAAKAGAPEYLWEYGLKPRAKKAARRGPPPEPARPKPRRAP
jgi:ATP:cob(I)alamin adenosyltransferase